LLRTTDATVVVIHALIGNLTGIIRYPAYQEEAPLAGRIAGDRNSPIVIGENRTNRSKWHINGQTKCAIDLSVKTALHQDQKQGLRERDDS